MLRQKPEVSNERIEKGLVAMQDMVDNFPMSPQVRSPFREERVDKIHDPGNFFAMSDLSYTLRKQQQYVISLWKH